MFIGAMVDVQNRRPTVVSMRGAVINGRVLVDGLEEPQATTVTWSDGRIESIGAAPAPDAVVIDAGGALVAPGIVDLHGDAFERSLMPRGGVWLPMTLALAENDAQLLAAGITTSFLSATDSWEPGLRSRETLRALVAALRDRSGGPDVLLHVRHERCNTDGLDELVGMLESGEIAVLSYNDHTPGGNPHIVDISASQLGRSGVSDSELRSRLDDAIGRREVGRRQELELAAVARAVGVSTASHDPAEPTDLTRDLELGVRFAEFPLSIELAAAYREAGLPVLLGAPNLVRGGSHIGNLAVSDAIEAGVCDILSSDYHYPSLLEAPFRAVDDGLAPLADAWAMVSGNPADAAGLADRGQIRPGSRADIVVVERRGGAPAQVRAAVVAGSIEYTRATCGN